MSNFLSAGIINDTIVDICEKISEAQKYLDEKNYDSLQKTINELEDITLDLGVFIEKFSCKPLIYTGQGSTEEIIKRLDWAVTFIEEIDPIKFINSNKKIKKSHLKQK